MDVVVLALVLLGLTALVAAPLYRASGRPPVLETHAGGEGAGTEARQRALADLEVDRASGLIDDATYRAEHDALRDD
jgi:hypothetical protein